MVVNTRTVRDRSRGRGRSSSSSSSASSHRREIKALASQRSTSTSERSTPSPGPMQKSSSSKMAAENGGIIINNNKIGQHTYNAPKRFETTCYFMPLAVPVWYSTSVSIKINSTKRSYKETVNYKKKLVPYRFVETMTTLTPGTTPPVVYVSEVNIESKIPPNEHYISLEPQQGATVPNSYSADHHINILNHT